MEENKLRAHRFLFPLAFFFLITTVLFGQERDGYRIERDGRFVQIFSWTDQANVLYYRIEIERQEGETWETAADEKTETAFFEFSLRPGTHRYRVWAYDLLGKTRGPADWIQFEVLPAKEPVISRFNPEGFYLDEDLNWVLNLSGWNLVEGMRVYLQRYGSETRIQPRTVTAGGRENEARLVFDFSALDVGEYAVHAVNPGGLETSVETFRIAFRKPVDINVSAGYRPSLSLYGEINELFDEKIFPLGAYGRLSVVPFKRRWGYLGVELEPSWTFLRHKDSDYEVEAQLAGGTISGLYQWWLPNRLMALNFRLGGGIYAALNYHFVFDRGSSESITVLIPVAAGGVFFQWFVKKPFFVEAGVDFIHFFSADNVPPGYLRPSIGAGWQF